MEWEGRFHRRYDASLVVSFYEERAFSAGEARNSLNRHSKTVGESPGELQSPETSGGLGGLRKATGSTAAWSGPPKDTGRAQSEGCVREDFTEDHILFCTQGPEMSWRTVEIIKGF